MWTSSQNFRSLAVMVRDWRWLEDLEEKGDSLNQLISDKGVCRTAPATPGLLKSNIQQKTDIRPWKTNIEQWKTKIGYLKKKKIRQWKTNTGQWNFNVWLWETKHWTIDIKNYIDIDINNDIDNIDTEVSTVSFSYACLCRLKKKV